MRGAGAGKGPVRGVTRELLVTLRRVPLPDFDRSTKGVVAKWFNRGLSGHVLWLVGSAILRDRFGRREDWT